MKAAYHHFKPSERCRAIVEEIWVQESPTAPTAMPTTILPNGRIELVIHYGDPFVSMTCTGPKTMSSSHIVGQQHRPISVKASGRTGVVIVRFYPWSASALLRQPLEEFSDDVVELSHIWSHPVVGQVLDEVYSATTPRGRANAVDDFVSRELGNDEPDRACKASIDLMNTNWGRRRIESIAEQLGMSRRQLGRRFCSGTGTSPKRMSRLLRAQKAVTCIRNRWHVHDVVEMCGYADQSHLIHDIVSHTGKRPSELVRKENTSLQKYFNAADADEFCGHAYI